MRAVVCGSCLIWGSGKKVTLGSYYDNKDNKIMLL
jgi:hypothetical protein